MRVSPGPASVTIPPEWGFQDTVNLNVDDQAQYADREADEKPSPAADAGRPDAQDDACHCRNHNVPEENADPQDEHDDPIDRTQGAVQFHVDNLQWACTARLRRCQKGEGHDCTAAVNF